MKVKSKKIAYYSNKSNTKSPEVFDIDTFLSDVKNGRWEDQIHKLRITTDTEKQDELKNALPCVTVSGIFTERTDNTIETHSTFIAIDIDKQPHLNTTYPDLRDLIAKDFLVYAAFLSCRGQGVCALIKVDPKAHKEAYAWMSLHFYRRYNINTDPSCKNLSRIRFVSYDPDLRINIDATVCPATPTPKSQKKEAKKFQHFDKEFDRIIDESIAKNIDLTKTYNDWLYCGLSILDKYDEETARTYFHRLSEMHPEYDYDKTEQKFDNLLTTTRHEVPIDWFYNHIEKKGLKAYSKETEAKLVFDAISDAETNDNADPAQTPIDREIARQVLDEMPLVTKVKYFLKSKHPEGYVHNEFSDELTAGDTAITDRHLNSFYVECREKVDDKTQFDLIRRILNSDFAVSMHPFKDFIVQCEQKYTPEQAKGHIDRIIAALTSETVYSDLFIKKWLVAMVASAFGTPTDLVLVFCGPQGTGKTEWFRRILPDSLSRYRATLNWSGDRDEIIRMSRNLIMLDDEMGGKSQREEKQIKKISSIDKEQQRAAYKSMDEYFKRHAAFCGTTNDEWILSDPSGNRRFLPVYISAMDHEKFNQVDKDLLFYELYLEWKDGYPITLSPDDKIKLKEAGARFEKPHIEEELISKYIFAGTDKNGEYLTATDVQIFLREQARGLIIKLEKVGAALQNAGHVRRQKRINGKLQWVYYLSKESDFVELKDEEIL